MCKSVTGGPGLSYKTRGGNGVAFPPITKFLNLSYELIINSTIISKDRSKVIIPKPSQCWQVYMSKQLIEP